MTARRRWAISRTSTSYYREEIHSAEDFIALAASKSAMTGKPYLVRCDDDTEPAADWITRELNDFRQRSAS